MPKTKQFEVAVFVERGKRVWKFHAYTLWYNPAWDGCNIIHVEARNGTEAKKLAIARIKAKMDLNSTVPPSGINVCGEATEASEI